MQTKCGSCLIEKEDKCFYKDASRSNGLSCHCKDCIREQQRKSREADPEAARRKNRLRYHRVKLTPQYRIRITRKQKLRRAVHPDKYKARRKVMHEIEMGRMVRGVCACGSTENIQAHHEDYSKPMEVVWMCAVCHRKHHGSQK